MYHDAYITGIVLGLCAGHCVGLYVGIWLADRHWVKYLKKRKP